MCMSGLLVQLVGLSFTINTSETALQLVGLSFTINTRETALQDAMQYDAMLCIRQHNLLEQYESCYDYIGGSCTVCPSVMLPKKLY